MASKLRTASMAALASVIAFIVFSPKNSDSGTPGAASADHEAATSQKEAPVNFTLPLYTKQSALVCPLAVAFDRREGYGLKGAVDAHLSVFGHDEAIEKSGCQEWREGLPVSLTDEGRQQAMELENKQMCGMVDFDEGLIFSCDLRNAVSGE